MLKNPNVNDEFKSYLFSYNYNGSKWNFEILAEIPDNARQRVSRLAFASYDGEIITKVPANLEGLVRFLAASRNFGRKVHEVLSCSISAAIVGLCSVVDKYHQSRHPQPDCR
jgi:hypothetical protein